MKIFLSFLQSEQQYSIPAYSFWQHYIKNGITEAGHTWVEHPEADWAFGLVLAGEENLEFWRQETWDKTVRYLRKNPVDVFLSYLSPRQIDTGAIKEIQRLGIPCVNFFCDHVRTFTKIPAAFSVFDLNWVPEYKALSMYRQRGYPYIHLAMPMWLDPSYRVFKEEKNAAIAFIGSKDIQRLQLLESVVALNPQLPLAIFGRGWAEENIPYDGPSAVCPLGQKLKYQYSFIKNNGVVPYLRKLQQRTVDTEASQRLKSKINNSISFETYNQLTSESMVTLGINRYPSFHFPLSRADTYSRLRDIEAPMLGACYLTEQTEGIESLYEIGAEIEVYTEAAELVEKIRALQMDPEKRRSLKIKGQKRALLDHTVPRSILKIQQRLGL